MKSFKISNPKYPCLRAALLYGLILLFATQLINCRCIPNEKKDALTSFSDLELGDLNIQVTPTNLIGEQKKLVVKFTPTNKQKIFLDRYKLTIKVEDRAGVLIWDSSLLEHRTLRRIEIKNAPLTSFSLFTELDSNSVNYKPIKIKLLVAPDSGSRQIVIKFELYDTHNRLLQKAAATWRLKRDAPIPNPDDPIDPTAVTKRKLNPTPKEKKIEEDILRKEREESAREEEEKRREEEIRKKRGEEWLGGEGKKWQKYWEKEWNKNNARR